MHLSYPTFYGFVTIMYLPFACKTHQKYQQTNLVSKKRERRKEGIPMDAAVESPSSLEKLSFKPPSKVTALLQALSLTLSLRN